MSRTISTTFFSPSTARQTRCHGPALGPSRAKQFVGNLPRRCRAADLVRRILDFSRPAERERQLQPVQPVVEEALKLVGATLPSTIRIETSCPPNLPLVSLDATQIHQVIVNLATNASHAIGSAPSTITIYLASRVVGEEDRLLLPELQEGLYVCLSIIDSGCGMDAATVQRIFDPFFTTKPIGQGTGLGLSVVHGIVSSYGGTITVYSEPGKVPVSVCTFLPLPPRLQSPALLPPLRPRVAAASTFSMSMTTKVW